MLFIEFLITVIQKGFKFYLKKIDPCTCYPFWLLKFTKYFSFKSQMFLIIDNVKNSMY